MLDQATINQVSQMVASGELVLTLEQQLELLKAAGRALAPRETLPGSLTYSAMDGPEGWLGYIYETVDYASVTDGSSASVTFTNPIGTNNLALMTFDPTAANKIKIELSVQSSRLLVLNGFQNDIGNVGILPLKQPSEATDKFICKVTNKSGGTLTDISISFGFDFERPV